MADLDIALDEALRRHDPAWRPPDQSEFMRRQRAELVDIEPAEPGTPVVLDDDRDDFTVDDADGRSVSRGSGRSTSDR